MKVSKEIVGLINKLFKKQIGQGEIDRLDKWYNGLENQGQGDGNGAHLKEIARKRVLGHIAESRTRQRKEQMDKVWAYTKVAASLALLLGFFLFLKASENTEKPSQGQGYVWKSVENKVGQVKKLTLSDGTIVWLGPASALEYQSPFQQQRLLRLKGEAFFEVARDEKRPFVIESEEIMATVLGTSFNISTYPSEKNSVAVTSGKVKVASRETHGGGSAPFIILEKDQKASFSPKQGFSEVENFDKVQFTAWREGKLIFRQTPMKEVVAQLKKWHGHEYRFASPAIADCTITGEFKASSLHGILESISYSLNIQYEWKDGIVTFDGKSCKAPK